MTMTALEKAIDILGSQSALARAIGTLPQNVSYWVKNGWVPAEAVLPIEKATKKKVRRYELRPDIYPKRASQSSH